MAQQEKKHDIVDRFADGLEKFADNLKANPPGYERQKQEGKIRAKWRMLCALVALPIALLALWICSLFGWPKQIYLTVIPMIALGGIQVVGDSLAVKAIKRDGLS